MLILSGEDTNPTAVRYLSYTGKIRTCKAENIFSENNFKISLAYWKRFVYLQHLSKTYIADGSLLFAGIFYACKFVLHLKICDAPPCGTLMRPQLCM